MAHHYREVAKQFDTIDYLIDNYYAMKSGHSYNQYLAPVQAEAIAA
jgi:hypothetical protein